jgi:hypothetical protein
MTQRESGHTLLVRSVVWEFWTGDEMFRIVAADLADACVIFDLRAKGRQVDRVERIGLAYVA